MEMGDRKMNKAFLLIITGAALWGTIGWYVKNLYSFGFTPMEVVSLRAWTSALMLVIFLFLVSRDKLKLHKTSDLKYFVGTGVLSIVFFNYCLFTAIELSTIPVAIALLYTGPAFVTIMSFFIFKEALTKVKLLSLLITLVGTCLVVGILPVNVGSIHIGSILFGLGAGLGYAMYSIFSKFALRKYSSLQITTFTFIVAGISLLPFFPYKEKLHILLNPNVLLYAFGLGLLPTAFAYIIYTYGLQQTEASKASILTTVEPVVATLLGIFVFQEHFSIIQLLGMTCIIGAVILIQIFTAKPHQQLSP